MALNLSKVRRDGTGALPKHLTPSREVLLDLARNQAHFNPVYVAEQALQEILAEKHKGSAEFINKHWNLVAIGFGWECERKATALINQLEAMNSPRVEEAKALKAWGKN